MRSPIVSDEDKLTCLISELINWVDDEMPGALNYGDMSLKEGLERLFYFSAMHNQLNLQPLLRAGSGWRLQASSSTLSAFYDELTAQCSNNPLSNKLIARLKTVLRVCKFITKRKHLRLDAKPTLRIGFFAINARFVRFFEDYARSLGGEKVLFFCATAEAAHAATELGFPVAMETAGKIELHKLNLSMTHPLFPAYWIVLQSYLRLSGTIHHYQPATIVFAEGTSMDDQIAGLTARLSRIPTIRLQSGRGGILHSGYRNMAFDKMLCWGNGFVERYRQYTPKAEYIITGSPLISASPDRKTFSVDRVTCVILTQPINKYLSSKHYEELAMLARQLLSEYKGMHLLIRKHPVDQCEILDLLAKDYPNRITMADYGTWNLKRVMETADIAIGFYSTTLSESAACGVIPLILKLENAHSVFPFPEQYGAAIEVSNIEAAIEVIDRLLSDPAKQVAIRQHMANFAREFFGPQDGKAMERIMHCLIQTAGMQ